MFLVEWLFQEKCLETGVVLCNLRFWNISEMFIHSLSEWCFGFPNVLESTLKAVYDINQVV